MLTTDERNAIHDGKQILTKLLRELKDIETREDSSQIWGLLDRLAVARKNFTRLFDTARVSNVNATGKVNS